MGTATGMRDWVPLVVAFCALFAGSIAAIASMRATRVNQETNQIKWIQEARDQATAVRKDLDETTQDLAQTKRDLGQTKREVIEQRDLVEELTRWIIRVVGWAHDATVDGTELRRLINGGPPSMRASLRRDQESGRTDP